MYLNRVLAIRFCFLSEYVATVMTRICKAGVVFLDAAAVVNDTSGQKAGGSYGSMMRFEDLMKVVSGQGSQYSSGSENDSSKESDSNNQKKHQKNHQEESASAAQVILQDPTHSDTDRLVVGSSVSNAVTRIVRKQPLVSIYVPYTLHFSLLASIRGMAVPIIEKKKKKLDPLSAILSSEKQKLR
jgi:hypothetical protein